MSGPIATGGDLSPLEPIIGPDGAWTLPRKSNLRPENHYDAALWAWLTYQNHGFHADPAPTCGGYQCAEYKLSVQVFSRLNFPLPHKRDSPFPLAAPTMETPDEAEVAVE